MKKTKRLLSLLLAAALAGQMGVVAWGTGGAATPTDCESKGHGSLQRVTAACTENHAHWLESDSTKVINGGSGDNYFFVKSGDSVTCGTVGNNFIVVRLSSFADSGDFNLADFRTGTDKIYVLGKSTESIATLSVVPDPANSGRCEISIGGKTITIIGSNIDPNDVEGKVGSELKSLTLAGGTKAGRGELKKIKATPSGGIGNVTYTWEKYTDTVKENLPNTGETYDFTVPGDAAVGAKYTFKCTVTDSLGCTAVAETTITVSGCDETVTLGDISGLPTVQAYAPEKDEALDLTCPITENQSGQCNIHGTDKAHGHTVAWSVSPENQGAAVVTQNGKTQLRLTAASLPDAETTFTVTAKLDGKDEQVKSAAFTAKKYVAPFCSVTPKPRIVGAAEINETGSGSEKYTVEWAFENENCNIPGHKDNHHGYWVTGWTLNPFQPSYVTGFSSSDGEIVFDAKKLPSTPEKLTLTAAITNNPAARSGDATVDKVITFQNNAKAACNAAPKEIKIAEADKKIVFTDSTTDTEKLIELGIEWNQNGCSTQHIDQATHDKTINWSVDDAAKGWASIVPENGKGKLTIKKNDLPNATDNKVTVIAAVTKPDGTVDTKTIDIFAERPKRCNKKIKSIDKITGQPHIYVEQGDERIEVYRVNKENLTFVDDKATCELSDDSSHVCGEAIKWSIQGDIVNKDRMEKDAITITEDGKLTVKGGKLQERNTYKATIQAAVPGNNSVAPKTCLVEIHCTAPDDDDSDDSDLWESYEDKIEDAKRGSTVKLDLTGNGNVPFYVFDSARGRDVTLQMKAGKNYTWTINGKSMKKWPSGQIYLPLEVETLKDKTLTRLCRDYDVRTFQLRHKGSFYGDMKLTVDVGVGNAKKTMFLYSYDEDKERLTYQSSALADNNGDVTFVMTRSLGAYAVTTKALYGEKPVSSGGGLVGGGSGNGPTTVYPPVAPATSAAPSSSQSQSSSSSSSSSSESSSSQSESALPPEPPSSSQEPAAPTDTETQPKEGIPILVPVLILAIAGVITATVLVVRSSRGKLDDFDED